jgi:TRAP-type C4-dicarboxylate transport system substrate-binding protein
MAEMTHADEALHHVEAQLERLEKKVVEDTEKEGGTVHEFNPDATPEQKAASVKKVLVETQKAFRAL